MDQNTRSKRVAFLLDNLAGGGAEKVMLNLAYGIARLGHPVDLLVCKMEGALRDKIPNSHDQGLDSGAPLRIHGRNSAREEGASDRDRRNGGPCPHTRQAVTIARRRRRHP